MVKPSTQDGINFSMHGCVLKVLTIDEIIQNGDYIRPTVERPMMSRDGGWDTTYKNDKWRGPMWHRVEDEIPYWIGKTYHDFIKRMFDEDYGQYPIDDFIHDEIVRIVE
jgi:hypothetical protein